MRDELACSRHAPASSGPWVFDQRLHASLELFVEFDSRIRIVGCDVLEDRSAISDRESAPLEPHRLRAALRRAAIRRLAKCCSTVLLDTAGAESARALRTC